MLLHNISSHMLCDQIAYERTISTVSPIGTSIIASNGTRFVMVTSAATIAYSTDTINWTSVTLPTVPPLSGYWSAIASDGSSFVIVSNNSGIGSTVGLYSADGITWVQITIPLGWWNSVASNGSTYVIIGSSGGGTIGTLATSTNGTTWVSRTLPASNLLPWQEVCSNGIIFCIYESDNTGGSRSSYTSPDGITWAGAGGNIPVVGVNKSWSTLTSNGSIFVLGSSISQNITTSSDGLTWTSLSNPFLATTRNITSDSNLFYAFSNSGGNTKLHTSPNGITWTNQNTILPLNQSTSFYSSSPNGQNYNSTKNPVLVTNGGVIFYAIYL